MPGWRGCVAILAVAVLAGCTAAPPATAPQASGTQSQAPAQEPAPVTSVAHAVEWSGRIPNGVWACGPVAGCVAEPAAAYGVDFTDPLPAGTVISGNLTLSLIANGPLTDNMNLGVLLRTGDNETHVAPDVMGTSPIVFPTPAGTAIAPATELHLWVYGPYQEVSPAVIGWSADQAFDVAGDLLVQP